MKLLFICTHNRCRSILAEAISRHVAGDQIESASAGSQAVENVHPLTLRYLRERGISTDGLRSKSWDEVEDFNPDAVITVCDSAANEVCPAWMNSSLERKALKVHWGLPDPSRAKGSEQEIAAAFTGVMDTLEKRVRSLATEDLESMSPDELKRILEDLSELN
ncbi:arsenate reductase ArsC [Proteobacteria bacterium 005FR1]|nr:arsenate reductase ArsC [Proteobacteria bacterium 005FR1]